MVDNNDIRVRKQRLAYYEKSLQAEVQAFTSQIMTKKLSGLSADALKVLLSRIDQAWRAIAQKKLGGAKAHYLPRYLAGIQNVQISGNEIKLKLITFDAVKVEIGWAPPDNRNSTISDGLGKFDNRPHDLRPLLLWSGKAPNRKISSSPGNRGRKRAIKLGKGKWQRPTRSGAMHWKTIKLEMDEKTLRGGSGSLTEEVIQWLYDRSMVDTGATTLRGLTAKEEAKQAGKSLASKRIKLWLSKIDAIEKRMEEKEPGHKIVLKFSKKEEREVLPPTKTILWQDTMKNRIEVTHRNFLFQRLRIKKQKSNKFSFYLLRTISDSPKQMQNMRWFSNGTPPHNIVTGDPNGNDLAHEVARLIGEVGMPAALKQAAAAPPPTKNVKMPSIVPPVTSVSGSIATTRVSAGVVRRRGAATAAPPPPPPIAAAMAAPATPAAIVASATRTAPPAPMPVSTPTPVTDPPAQVKQLSENEKIMAELLAARADQARLRGGGGGDYESQMADESEKEEKRNKSRPKGFTRG